MIALVCIALAIPIWLKMFGMVKILFRRMFPSGLPRNLKRESIAGCIGVAFCGYEHEVIQLLSRIEKSNVSFKSSCRELRLLLEGIGSFVVSNLESTMIGLLPLLVG